MTLMTLKTKTKRIRTFGASPLAKMARAVAPLVSLSLATVVVVACGATQQPPCVETTYLLPEERLLQEVVYHYDDSDDPIGETRTLGGADEPFETVEFVFDDDGNITGHRVNTQDDDGQMVESTSEFTYDDRGNVIGERLVVDEASQSRREYVFDDQDNRVEELQYGPEPDEELIMLTMYSYNDRGLLAATDVDELADGELESGTIFTYDDQDRISVIEIFVGSNSVAQREEYIYDENSGTLQIEQTDHEGDGEFDIVTTHIYDEEDQDVRIRSDVDFGNDMTVDQTVEYLYDEDGRLIGQVEMATEDNPDVESTRMAWDYSCWEQ